MHRRAFFIARRASEKSEMFEMSKKSRIVPTNKRPPALQVTAARAKAAALLAAPGVVRLLDKHEVCAIAGVSFPTIWTWMRGDNFPRSRVVGGKSVWLSSEIDAWLAQLPVRRLKGDKPEAASRLNVGGTR
jgi:predicted DNA-binding transcriptional regulator AlpA